MLVSDKTKTILITRNIKGNINIKVEGSILELVQQLKYLSTRKTEDAKTETELKCIIDIAKGRFSTRSTIFTSRKLSMKLKLRFSKCYVFSIIFAYGAEAWTHMLQNRIVVSQIGCLRRIGRINWKQNITNLVVLNKLNADKIYCKQLKKEN